MHKNFQYEYPSLGNSLSSPERKCCNFTFRCQSRKTTIQWRSTVHALVTKSIACNTCRIGNCGSRDCLDPVAIADFRASLHGKPFFVSQSVKLGQSRESRSCWNVKSSQKRFPPEDKLSQHLPGETRFSSGQTSNRRTSPPWPDEPSGKRDLVFGEG